MDILTVYHDDLTWVSGTSFATGIVSGTLGLFRAQYPQLDNASTILLMEQTADSLDELNPGYDGLLGAGRINAFAGVVSGLAEDDSTGRFKF